MSSIKTNEREISGKVAQWFNEHIERNDFPFTSVSNEPGIESGDTTYFGDVIIWTNRETNDAYSYIEIKPPYQKENLERFRKKAIQLKVNFAFTWDFQTLHVYKVSDNKVELHDSEATPILNNIAEWLEGHKQAKIIGYIHRICDELVQLHKTGQFSRFKPEKIYFVTLIRNAVDNLVPDFTNHIRENYRKPQHKYKIDKYVAEQKLPYSSHEGFYSILARQRVYGLVTKIIFYLTIKRYFTDLPDLTEGDTENLSRSLQIAFAKASDKDWQAVFLDGPIEELGMPQSAETHLRYFFEELKAYYFDELSEDVIGEIFEEIIDPQQRHYLGQYFTSEDLVDFVIGTIVHDKNGIYADPTCGSGTFLIRLYDRLKFLSQHRAKHNELLNQIWGVDVGKFPAELSTINLFRQDARNFENFPRVLHKNIFDICPNKTFDFPPPSAGKNYNKIKITLPQFHGLVGNFPYIRQELISKEIKEFKDDLTKLLAEEYLLSYPKLFELKKINGEQIAHLQQQPPDKQKKLIHDWVDKKFIQLKLSGQADIYSYIFIHTATLLAQNGSFAIITSNSWLDVAYGSVLKDFFLDHFKIKMIVGSWAEPWFDDAAVNTVITVLEKESNEKQREKNLTRFVKLKKKLSELIPFHDLKLDSVKRWECVDTLIRQIESAENHKKCRSVTSVISSLENEDMRIRMIPQSELKKELQEKKELDKWGKYLRAPDVYFEILEQCKDKLVPLKEVADVRFGIKTGINDFFYLEPLRIVDENANRVAEPAVEYLTPHTTVLCRNARGWEGNIESKYLRKIIKSPKEADSIIIDTEKLKYFIFICNKSKAELRKAGDYGALKYIEWGEKQKTEDGVSWANVPSVQGREYWWDIKIGGKYDVLISRFFDKRFLFPDLDNSLLAGDTYFVFSSKSEKGYRNKIFLNSSIYHLFVETQARNNMCDGLLTFYGPDIESTYLLREDLKINFAKKIKREIKPIFEEIKLKDRKELDTAVLEAMGLDAKEFLPRIYDGLCEMVSERLELPKMRKKKQKDKVQFAYNEVKEAVINDIIPKRQSRKFPNSFYTGMKSYEKLEFDIYPATGEALHYSAFFNQFEIKSIDNKILFTLDSEVKARFACILAKQNIYSLKIPKEEKICEQMMKSYEHYKNELQKNLEANAKTKLHDWALAEKMAKEIMKDYGIK